MRTCSDEMRKKRWADTEGKRATWAKAKRFKTSHVGVTRRSRWTVTWDLSDLSEENESEKDRQGPNKHGFICKDA